MHKIQTTHTQIQRYDFYNQSTTLSTQIITETLTQSIKRNDEDTEIIKVLKFLVDKEFRLFVIASMSISETSM